MQIRYPDHIYIDRQTTALIERSANGLSSELLFVPESLKSLEIVALYDCRANEHTVWLRLLLGGQAISTHANGRRMTGAFLEAFNLLYDLVVALLPSSRIPRIVDPALTGPRGECC